ncbi:hypothetical protein ACWCV9_37420 [Streptomyces sp. NPDC001606]
MTTKPTSRWPTTQTTVQPPVVGAGRSPSGTSGHAGPAGRVTHRAEPLVPVGLLTQAD